MYLVDYVYMLMFIDSYDRKLEEEIMNYNPFGRGGAGAPMKDDQGNTISKCAEYTVCNYKICISFTRFLINNFLPHLS